MLLDKMVENADTVGQDILSSKNCEKISVIFLKA